MNRWVPELRSRGVEAIVVLAHAGGPTQDESDAPDYVGEILDEAREMSSEVDVVVAGHSHSRIHVRLPNSDGSGDKLIVEALSYGVAYDQVDMRIDTRTGEVLSKSAEIPGTEHAGVEGDAGMAALVERYRQRVAPLADHVVGLTQGTAHARRRRARTAHRECRAGVRPNGCGRGEAGEPARGHRCGPDHATPRWRRCSPSTTRWCGSG